MPSRGFGSPCWLSTVTVPRIVPLGDCGNSPCVVCACAAPAPAFRARANKTLNMRLCLEAARELCSSKRRIPLFPLKLVTKLPHLLFRKSLMLGHAKTTHIISELTMESPPWKCGGGFLDTNHFVVGALIAHSGRALSSRRQVLAIFEQRAGHCRDIFATRAGTARRGIKRCAKTLNLFIKPGITSPPPFARDSNASRTTSSGA